MKDRGIVYVATQHPRFVCEAITSAESTRRFLPRVHITLFTDLADALQLPGYLFDDVVAIGTPPGEVGRTLARGHLTKVQTFARWPRERGLFLDTDTRVLSAEVLRAFDLLDTCSFAAVECTPRTSRSCALYGPMYNTGVIAFRQDDSTRRLFAEWENLYEIHRKLAASSPPGATDYVSVRDEEARRYLLETDQLALAQLLSPDRNVFQVPVRALDASWNWRDVRAQPPAGVKIHHSPRYKVHPSDVGVFLDSYGLSGWKLAPAGVIPAPAQRDQV
jgi:hypothetical protein